MLYWQRTGFCLWLKRLEEERFKWPFHLDGPVVELDEDQFRSARLTSPPGKTGKSRRPPRGPLCNPPLPSVVPNHAAALAPFCADVDTFLDAYNFAKRLKTLRGLTPFEHVCKVWADEPDRLNAIQSTSHRD